MILRNISSILGLGLPCRDELVEESRWMCEHGLSLSLKSVVGRERNPSRWWAGGTEPCLGGGGPLLSVYIFAFKESFGLISQVCFEHKWSILKTKEHLLLPSSLPQRPAQGWGSACCWLLSLPARLASILSSSATDSPILSLCYSRLRLIGWSEFSG